MVATPREQPPRFLRRAQNRPALRRRSSLAIFGQLLLVSSGLGVGGAAAYFGHDYLLNNDTFRLRRLVLDEVPAELREVVRLQLDPARGANLLLVDLEGLRERVELVPEVGTARLRRVLPDALEITVEPRPAWGVLQARDGRRRVARNGIVLGEVRAVDRDLPVLALDAEVFSRVDGSRSLPDSVAETAAFPAAVAVVEWLAIGNGRALGPIDAVRLDGSGVVLVMRSRQWEVALGDGRDLDQKEQNLLALVRQGVPPGPRLIDLRYRDMVVVGALEPVLADAED